MAADGPPNVVIAGVAGSGKTTVGKALAAQLGARFVDGDDLHPVANVDKMAAGQPLSDDDRWPWLASVRQTLRASERTVVACSALRRQYRDMLRHADNVVFVHLGIDSATAARRLSERAGHYMGTGMVQSQFDALELPTADEGDVVVLQADVPVEAVVEAAASALDTLEPGLGVAPLVAEGGSDRRISPADLEAHVEAVTTAHILAAGYKRVLLVPPDHTRLHSHAGQITVAFRNALVRAGREVAILPAVGTHVPMGDAEAEALFGGSVSADDLLVHDWRNNLRELGEISGAEVAVATQGRYAQPIGIAVDRQLFEGWDVVVSIGQVVPHEVIGMANFTKNIVIGLGGAQTIQRSHFVGAVAGMESIMGQTASPVRDLVDAAFDRFVAPKVPVLWALTVVEDTTDGKELRGFYAGAGGSIDSGGAAFGCAAKLSQEVNVRNVERPLDRVVCWLDPAEFHSTWVGNKAIYRTRMAMADGGELVVLAPGVCRFGEDHTIDALIRRYGYRGTPQTLAAVEANEELATNLAAAAHLIHGSTEGRFAVVYCTDPDVGGLTQAEVESVGFAWRPLQEELNRLGLQASSPGGTHTDTEGNQFFFVPNPGLGLWRI